MVENKNKPVVLITGVSGFLGSHVVNVFLKDGGFDVRGTVRDLSNEKKIEPLRKAFGKQFENLTLVEADLLNADSIIKAIKGADYVVHIASPCPLIIPKDEMELIKPAVEGTLAVMKGCHLHKVKRVVITSSMSAIKECKPHDMPRNKTFNEANWSDPDGSHINAYSKSKTLAEKAAWDFQKRLPEHERFEIVVLNPTMMAGPAYFKTESSSA
jgi:nucleoside-diphosphate-sugar epimerase